MNANLPKPELTPGQPAIEAFVALAGGMLDAIDGSIDALASQDDPEGAHALRVTVRHARAIRWVFGPTLPPEMNVRWRDALAGLMRSAGELRDWDVFFEDTLDPAQEAQPGDPVLAGIRDTAVQRREDARRTLLAQLEAFAHWPSPVLRQDLDALRLAGDAGTLPRRAREPIEKFGRRRARRARRQVQRLARRAHDDLDALHRLRIAGKRLRYAIEALAPILPERYTAGMRRKLVKRQNRLGRQLDAAIARRLLTECLMSPPAHRSATIPT